MFEIGDIVRSKVNDVYNGTYTITKVNKTTVWVRENEGHEKMIGGKITTQYFEYKNIRYSVLAKVK